MFSQACVKNSVHGGEVVHPQGRHPPGRQIPPTPSPPRDGYCCRRYASYWNAFLLPPANEVWGKIICIQVSVCPQGGGGLVLGWCLVLGGHLILGGGTWSRGKGCLVQGVWSGGCLVETPSNGYSCGQYASYWNAFLFFKCFFQVINLKEACFCN